MDNVVKFKGGRTYEEYREVVKRNRGPYFDAVLAGGQKVEVQKKPGGVVIVSAFGGFLSCFVNARICRITSNQAISISSGPNSVCLILESQQQAIELAKYLGLDPSADHAKLLVDIK
uniref:hypothetical protein n=1 Tax=Thaumasiovibrio occultus TaxID=1891184 RepID=UPI000B35FC5D|nr:hypothetical protein [Thaumasiovibrio occultus]